MMNQKMMMMYWLRRCHYQKRKKTLSRHRSSLKKCWMLPRRSFEELRLEEERSFCFLEYPLGFERAIL
jgi:hypothetical protein